MGTLIGDLISYYRIERKVSQEELAEGICSRRQIINIEQGANFPNLELLSVLSSKLNVNLFESYSNVYRQNTLSAHLKCMKINAGLTELNIDALEELYKEYENDPDFIKGEPHQILLYAKAIVKARNGKEREAIRYSMDGIKETLPQYPDWSAIGDQLSNIEIALLLSYSVYLCRIGKAEEGLTNFEEIEKRVDKLLHISLYEGDSKKSMWINTWCNCVYNEYSFGNYDEKVMLEKIDKVLDYQKENKRSYMITELLLCKAAILMNMGDVHKALAAYKMSEQFELFFSDREMFLNKAKLIMSLHSDLSLFETT